MAVKSRGHRLQSNALPKPLKKAHLQRSQVRTGTLSGVSNSLRLTISFLLLALCGCDTVSEDFDDFIGNLKPTSPFEAATWASDFNNPGKQREGVVLLANSYFGGAQANVKLYRILVEENSDPLVRAAAITALGRWGEAKDAVILADRLEDDFTQVRLEAAKALQRLHESDVETKIWQRLVNEDEEESIRIELAIALGQYASDASVQALIDTLEHHSLALNLAAADSLRLLTGTDHGLDGPMWLSWYEAQKKPFQDKELFLYPTFQRKVTIFERLIFWSPVTFQKPSVPRGLESKPRSTYDDTEYQNIGEGT